MLQPHVPLSPSLRLFVEESGSPIYINEATILSVRPAPADTRRGPEATKRTEPCCYLKTSDGHVYVVKGRLLNILEYLGANTAAGLRSTPGLSALQLPQDHQGKEL